DDHPRVSELVFRIDDVTKFKAGESIKSPTKLVELFNYQLEVYPMADVDDGLIVYLMCVPMEGVIRRITYDNVGNDISLVNHRDSSKSLVIKAQVNLREAKALLAPVEGVSVEGDELEFRIKDAVDFEKGEDMKSQPTWRGNYRMQSKTEHPPAAELEEGIRSGSDEKVLAGAG
ncbi:hypothetical protein FOZ63_032121, partial [Perkinsus olseni]